MYSVVDLFAGCGGLSKGFENAGFDVLAAFENWKVAAECYELNFDHPVYQIDLSDVNESTKVIASYSPDIIIGGPPCQDFSHAGKRIEADRADLTASFAMIIKNIKPKIFVMENVDRAQKSNAYSRARNIFKEAGYGLTERVMLASLCGAPQRRKRFFCIGILGGEDAELITYLESNLAETEMTVRDYLGDSLDTDFYYRHPRNYNRRGVFSIDEPAPTMRGVNRPIPKGYPGHPKDACPISDKVRPLTTLERALIQTFPAEYKWVGSKSDREQMIGNAVPVNLAAYIGRAIQGYIESQKAFDIERDDSSFTEWLSRTKNLSGRTLSDTKSRVNRAQNILSIENISEPEIYLARLDSIPDFSNLSSSVKSQIRRAVRLYCEFSESRINK